MGTAPLGKDHPQINFDKTELNILYKNFMSMDANKNGLVEPDEFFDVPELKDNPIVQRIINVFDKNGDGKISFYEFVWGLSALTSDAKLEEKQKKIDEERENLYQGLITVISNLVSFIVGSMHYYNELRYVTCFVSFRM